MNALKAVVRSIAAQQTYFVEREACVAISNYIIIRIEVQLSRMPEPDRTQSVILVFIYLRLHANCVAIVFDWFGTMRGRLSRPVGSKSRRDLSRWWGIKNSIENNQRVCVVEDRDTHTHTHPMKARRGQSVHRCDSIRRTHRDWETDATFHSNRSRALFITAIHFILFLCFVYSIFRLAMMQHRVQRHGHNDDAK